MPPERPIRGSCPPVSDEAGHFASAWYRYYACTARASVNDKCVGDYYCYYCYYCYYTTATLCLLLVARGQAALSADSYSYCLLLLLLTPTLDASSPTTAAAAAATAAAVAAAAAASGNPFFSQGKLLLRSPSAKAAIQPPRSMSLCCNSRIPAPPPLTGTCGSCCGSICRLAEHSGCHNTGITCTAGLLPHVGPASHSRHGPGL